MTRHRPSLPGHKGMCRCGKRLWEGPGWFEQRPLKPWWRLTSGPTGRRAGGNGG